MVLNTDSRHSVNNGIVNNQPTALDRAWTNQSDMVTSGSPQPEPDMKVQELGITELCTEARGNTPLSADLLTGAAAIAGYIGWPPRRVYYAADRKQLPIGRVGQILIARKSELDRALSYDSAQARG